MRRPVSVLALALLCLGSTVRAFEILDSVAQGSYTQ